MTIASEKSVAIWTKAELRQHYDALLEAGLSAEQMSYYRRHGRFGDQVIATSTSGSSGRPLVLPRSIEDGSDIGARMSKPHTILWGRPPQRLALLGGISHMEGALKIRFDGMELCSFELADVEALIDYAPDFISCYPSIVRELLARHVGVFATVKTIKLGGERVLDTDIAKIHAALPGRLIVEQLGSTEMPAVAVGASRQGETRRLELQRQRFAFLLEDTLAWQPLITRDLFPGRLLPFDAWYDAGDEVRLQDGYIVGVRRRDDPANAYVQGMEQLLVDGCVNVQIDRASRTVYCDGEIRGERVGFNGDEYRMVAGQMKRLKDSNKLPLLIG
jgi:hypothetical protein